MRSGLPRGRASCDVRGSMRALGGRKVVVCGTEVAGERQPRDGGGSLCGWRPLAVWTLGGPVDCGGRVRHGVEAIRMD